MPLQTQRYDAGVGVLKQVGGRDYDAPLKALEDIAPDLARFTVEFAYGDIMSRAALGLKTRQIATVAALAAMGNAQPQLRYHINGALNVGWAPSQISEAILLSTVYAGFPAALKGVFAAKEVFEQRGLMPITTVTDGADEQRYARGLRALEQVSGGSGADVVKSLADRSRPRSAYHRVFLRGCHFSAWARLPYQGTRNRRPSHRAWYCSTPAQGSH
jgi:4-carboxymuconolactone decarboxylase